MSDASATHVYAIALGSNRRHGRYGGPADVMAAAKAALLDAGLTIVVTSKTVTSTAVGPSLRNYANAVAIIGSELPPPALLALLKSIERDFGRRAGRRWGARVLDLDIVFWSGGMWSNPGLTIPHRRWRERRFVADPLAQIAPDWRDPVTGLSARQIAYRLRVPRPVDPAPRTA